MPECGQPSTEKFIKMVINADCGEELWFKISTICAGFGDVSEDYGTWNAVFTQWSATAKYKYNFHECQYLLVRQLQL